jgi:pilus assembly protein CpaE
MNSAAHLANGARGKTLLLDLDLTFGSVALSLDLEPGRGLREALEAPDRMDALLIGSSAIKINENFYVLASEEDVGAGLHPTGEAVNQLVDMVRPDYRNIVIDVPRDLAVAMPDVMARLDHLVIVSDLSLAGLRDANRLITFFKDVIDEGELSVMVNRTGINKRGEISERDFEKAIDRRLMANVAEDLKAAAVITRDARPVSESARNSRLDKSVRELAQKLAGGKTEEPKKDSKFKLKKKKA